MRFTYFKKDTKLASLTPLDQKRLSKQRAQEETEKIDALGQESETKAVKWVIEEGERERKEQAEEEAVARWKLEDVKKTVWTYKDSLLKEANRQIPSYELPSGFLIKASSGKQGLLFFVRDLKGNWYVKGMKISNIPMYDLQGIQRMVDKCLNVIDKLEDIRE